MFKALKSFCGKVSMKKNEIKDIDDKEIIIDLLNSGLIEEVKDESKKIITKVKEEIKNTEEEVKKEIKKTKTIQKKK